MKIYEVETNRIGESFCRAYCVAEDEYQARELFKQKNPDGYEIKHVWEVCGDVTKPYCSRISDSGWVN